MDAPIYLPCPVGSEGLSRAFYRDLLGLVEVAKPSSLVLRGGCWFRGSGVADGVAGGVEIRLEPVPTRQFGQLLDAVLTVADPGLVAERLGAAGHPVTPTGAPDTRAGFRSVDPHGNPLVFVARA